MCLEMERLSGLSGGASPISLLLWGGGPSLGALRSTHAIRPMCTHSQIKVFVKRGGQQCDKENREGGRGWFRLSVYLPRSMLFNRDLSQVLTLLCQNICIMMINLN